MEPKIPVTPALFTIMVVAHMGDTEPFVQTAVICDNVLLEQDGVASLIRIIDTVKAFIPKDAPPGQNGGFPVTVFLRLGSSSLKGKGKVSVQARRPDGTKGGKFEVEIELPGGGRGVQIKTACFILDPQNGFYWFDVFWNAKILTSIPIEITLAEVQATIQAVAPTPLLQPSAPS